LVPGVSRHTAQFVEQNGRFHAENRESDLHDYATMFEEARWRVTRPCAEPGGIRSNQVTSAIDTPPHRTAELDPSHAVSELRLEDDVEPEPIAVEAFGPAVVQDRE
jgi:hypothetical protein